MILEIALGIVLAVLILLFLPEIIALGAATLILGVVLLIFGVAAAFFWDKPEVFVAISILSSGYAIWWVFARFIQRKRPHLNLDEIQYHIFFALSLAVLILAAIVSRNLYAVALAAATGMGFCYYIVRWDRWALAEWTKKEMHALKEANNKDLSPRLKQDAASRSIIGN